MNDQGSLWDAKSGIIFSLLNLDDQGSLSDWEMYHFQLIAIGYVFCVAMTGPGVKFGKE